MLFRILSLWISLGLLSSILFSLPLYADENKSTEADQAGSITTSPAEQAKVGEKISEKRKEIVSEAVAAIENTKKALTALEKNKKQEALDALEKAVGELEVVLARDPNLALAAIDMQITIHDLYSSLEDIKQAKKQVEDYFEDNQIQKAREILIGLASEVIVSVTSIPLITYPKVIKDAISLIDADKIKQAKTELQVALTSLIVVNHVIPLAIIRAEEYLDEAEVLTEKKDRTDLENVALLRFLNKARYQLKVAEALGYGGKEDYSLLYEQLDEIEEKIGGDESGSAYFNEIREFLSELVKPFTEKE